MRLNWRLCNNAAPQRMSPAKADDTAPTVSQSRFPPLVKTLGEFFASKGVGAYLVGGVVRDALLGRNTGDVDLAVEGRARAIAADLAAALSGHSFVLDDARDIVRVAVPGGHETVFVDLTPLPEGIHADLARRDFTLNAVAASVLDVAADDGLVPIVDPYDGASDARAGVIKAVSPSVFGADPVRLMRGPRLSAQLGFRIADETAELIQRDAHLVTTVSQERVRDELMKLMAEPNVVSSLRLLDRLGLLSQLIAEIDQTRGVGQPKEHHWDVFNHIVETVGQVERLLQGPRAGGDFVRDTMPRFPSMEEHFAQEASDGHSRLTLLKFAGLLHDISKPATKTVESTGRIRFLGHHMVGAEVSVGILGRLRFSGRGIDLVSSLVQHHLRPGQMSQSGELPTRKAVYRYYRDVGDAAIDTLYLNLADFLAARGPGLNEADWADHCRVVGHVLDEGAAMTSRESPPRLVDGHEVMELLALAPGPRVGELLDSVHEAQASGEIASKEEALQLVRARMSSGGHSA